MSDFTIGVDGRELYVVAEQVNATEHGLEFLNKGYRRVAFFRNYSYFIQTTEVISDANA